MAYGHSMIDAETMSRSWMDGRPVIHPLWVLPGFALHLGVPVENSGLGSGQTRSHFHNDIVYFRISVMSPDGVLP